MVENFWYCAGDLLNGVFAAARVAREVKARGARMALGISLGAVRTLRMADIVGQLGRERRILSWLEIASRSKGLMVILTRRRESWIYELGALSELFGSALTAE